MNSKALLKLGLLMSLMITTQRQSKSNLSLARQEKMILDFVCPVRFDNHHL